MGWLSGDKPKAGARRKASSKSKSSKKIKVHPPQAPKPRSGKRGGSQRTGSNSVNVQRVEKVKVNFFPFTNVAPSVAPTNARTTKKGSGRGRGGKASSGSWLYGMFYWGAVAGLWVIVALSGLMIYYSVTLPDPLIAGLQQRGQAIKVLARDGSIIAERGLSQNYVKLSKLPKYVPQAVIAIEDRRFYSHFGFDPIGFSRAMLANLRAGRLVQGGSSISQQLAKNLFLNSDRTVLRKVREVGMAFWLEYKFSKNEILELYLNRVYLGQQAYGIGQAARIYFGKKATELDLPESAMIAGLLKAPSNLNPKRNYKAAVQRANLVLDAMREEKYISAMTAKTAHVSPAVMKKRRLPINSNYIADWIADLVPEYVTDYSSDLIIETTIDKTIQAEANASVRNWLNKTGKASKVSQASVVTLSPNGAVRAMVGGRDYQRSQYNRAIKSRRQTGSAFKPFVYLAALESGFRSDSLIFDEPRKFNRWQPKNYKGIYRGQIDLKTALAHSSNVVAVKLMGTVGVAKTIETARRLGMRGKFKNDLSLALGTAEQSLLELTTAYVPFANGGRGVLPYVITRIRKQKGGELYRHRNADLGQVISSGNVNELNKMMREVVKSGTGRKARVLGHEIAGKTGTTQNFKDGWFVGYSGHYITGVWVGNDNGRSMNKVTGGGLPALIWSETMAVAHKDVEPVSMLATRPDAVVKDGWREVGLVRRIKPQFFEKVLE